MLSPRLQSDLATGGRFKVLASHTLLPLPMPQTVKGTELPEGQPLSPPPVPSFGGVSTPSATANTLGDSMVEISRSAQVADQATLDGLGRGRGQLPVSIGRRHAKARGCRHALGKVCQHHGPGILELENALGGRVVAKGSAKCTTLDTLDTQRTHARAVRDAEGELEAATGNHAMVMNSRRDARALREIHRTKVVVAMEVPSESLPPRVAPPAAQQNAPPDAQGESYPDGGCCSRRR